MLKTGVFLAMLGLPFAAHAQTAQTCVTRTEAQSLVQFVLPDAITGIRDKCATTLSPSGFLSKSGSELAKRYKPGAALAWPKAKPVALRMAGDMSKLISAMPDEGLRILASNFVSAAVAKELPVEKCAPVDRVMEAVAPLPPENMAMLIVTLMEFQNKPAKPVPGKDGSSLTICSIMPTPATVTIGSK